MTGFKDAANTHPSLTLLGTGTSMGVPMIGCECEVCSSSDPKNQRMRSGVVVSHHGQNFLIDTSPELRLQLVNNHVQMIEGVVYTHAHADHIMGLDDLRIFGFKRKGPVTLYCEQPVEETLRNTFSYAFANRNPKSLHSLPALQFERICLTPFELCGLTIQPIRFIHGYLPILGFRINNVAFCTDVSKIPDESWEYLQGLDTLILGAIGHSPHPTHFNIEQALETIEIIKPQQTYLTHISHQLDYSTTNAKLPEHVQLAFDGMTIPL